MQANPSIVVVLMGSIGDFVRGLALASQLKRAYPQGRLTWIVEPACAALACSNRYIDEVIVFQRKEKLRGVLSLRRELSMRRFDICLDLQRHFKSGLFARLTRAPRRIGFHPRNAKEGNWLFQTEYIEYANDETSKLDHYLMFLSKLGVDVQRPFDFGLAQEDEPEPVRALRAKAPLGYVAIVLGSSWRSKDWMLDGYRRLIELIFQHSSSSVVLCGDSSQQHLARMLMESGNSPRLIDTSGRTSLVELAHLLKGALACVGPDSGPAHIAAAVGTKHVTLFGPTSPRRVAPFGSEHLSILSPVGCSPCYRRVCPGLGTVCMRLISPESVWQRLSEAMPGSRGPSPSGMGST